MHVPLLSHGLSISQIFFVGDNVDENFDGILVCARMIFVVTKKFFSIKHLLF